MGALALAGLISFLYKKYWGGESGRKQLGPIPKDKFNILFIDDQTFQVVDILRKEGWINCTRVKDVEKLNDAAIASAHMLFVDIMGVGKKLGFKDEGLGLAAALKENFPEKFVVIYSAESQGNRLHPALNKTDAILQKNADPYEFIQLVQQASGHES